MKQQFLYLLLKLLNCPSYFSSLLLKLFRQLNYKMQTNPHEKIFLSLLIIREMQIKTMREHLTLVKMAITKKSTNNKCQTGSRERGTLLHCWWECKLVQPLWKTVQRFLKNLKIELPYNPATPHLGIYPDKTIIQKYTRTPMFIAALLTIAITWKQPQYSPTDKWMKKM